MDVSFYLIIMVGIVFVVAVLSIPTLFMKKCPNCGKRNFLEATVCKACHTPFPDEAPTKTDSKE